ncbi:MAG: YggT family protein [Chloroflexota bacterium]
MNYILAQAINIFSNVLTIIILAHVILSYFMSPYHPIRSFIDKLVEPLLAPIRKVVPLIGLMDFSPVILLLLISFLSDIAVKLLTR